MLVDLKRYNSIGDVPGISSFLNIVFHDVCILEQSARELCSLCKDVRLNFDAAETFFVTIGWLDFSAGMLSATTKFPREGCSDVVGRICFDCLKYAIEQKLIDCETVVYDALNDYYVLQRYSFRVDAAIFRNVLLQFGALKENEHGFIVDRKYEPVLVAEIRIRSRKLSLERLKQIQELEAEQGEIGEEFVLEFERKRLSQIADRIKRISDVDVSAGYDIVSRKTYESVQADRFIEVKTYKGEVHFYWSENEIRTAKLYGERYVLALVDFTRIKEIGYSPRFIEDPARNLLNSKEWLATPTSYYMRPTEGGAK